MDTTRDQKPTGSGATRGPSGAPSLDGTATSAYDASRREDTLSLDPAMASMAWQVVSDQVEALSHAWTGAESPPDLAAFLPSALPAIRRLALIELIKIDLEQRWQRAEWRRLLEDYASQFPELSVNGELPPDLIYEELHVRRQAGEEVDANEYLKRFPRQAKQLANLLRLENPAVSTQVFSADRPENFEVGQTLEDFDLLEKLGQGAFATVFLAKQRSLGRRVALKISADRGEEARTMAQLDHPCVVRVFDERRLPGRKLRLLYIEYVPGGTLQAVVERIRALPPSARRGRVLLEAIDGALERAGQTASSDSTTRQLVEGLTWPEAVCWIGARLAGALDYLHRENVLHRDIKPANVLLAADGTPKLTDFNISYGSKVEGATAAAFFGGSLAYMSPEQLEAFNPLHQRQPDEVDHRCDIYALGILLWELLVGHRPFADDIVAGHWNETLLHLTVQRRAGVSAEAIRQLPPDAPPGLEALLLACLDPDPNKRPAAAGELSRQFAICLQPEAQRLLRPRKGTLSTRLRLSPVAALVTPGVLASVLASALSIAYNLSEIVNKKPNPRVREVFFTQLNVVNPVAYAVGVGVLLWLAWPVLRAVKRRHRGEIVPEDAAPRWRDRCLQLGDFVAWVTAALWTVSGVVFPAWLHLGLGEASGMQPSDYAHFVTVQFLLGLMAATLSFFLVTFVEVHGFYPVLVVAETEEAYALRSLRALERRIVVYIVLSFSAVPLSILALVLMGAESQKWFGILAVMGLLTSGISYWLSSTIRNDCEALAQAVRPSTGLWGRGGGADSYSDSMWTRSR